VPRRVASIDPQDFPCLPRRSPRPPVPPVSWVRPPAAACPHYAVAFFPHQLPPPPVPVSSVTRVAASPPVVPLRRPDYPSWFTSLFAVLLALSLASLATELPHRRRLSSGDADPTIVALLSTTIRRRRRRRHAESDGSDELSRVRGWIPRQSFEWRSKPVRWKRGGNARVFGASPASSASSSTPEDDRAEFLRRPDLVPASSYQAYQAGMGNNNVRNARPAHSCIIDFAVYFLC